MQSPNEAKIEEETHGVPFGIPWFPAPKNSVCEEKKKRKTERRLGHQKGTKAHTTPRSRVSHSAMLTSRPRKNNKRLHKREEKVILT